MLLQLPSVLDAFDVDGVEFGSVRNFGGPRIRMKLMIRRRLGAGRVGRH